MLGGPIPSARTEVRIVSTPLSRNARQSVEQLFAENPLSSTPASSSFSNVHWTYLEALSWFLYRNPEQVGSIDASDFRRLNWYNPAFQAGVKAFRRECELGNVKGFRRGTSIPPAGWVDLDARKDPHIVFAAADVFSHWPEPAGTLSDDAVLRERSASSEGQSPADLNGERLDDETRAKLIAIVDLYNEGARATGEYKNINPPRGVSRLEELAYRVLLRVHPERKRQHNAEVEKRRAAKARHENSLVTNGASPAATSIAARLPAQTRVLDGGFSSERIRHLILDLEANKHSWLIDGEIFRRMKNSPGVPPPDIDNEPCP
jgi:hypothetical protein